MRYRRAAGGQNVFFYGGGMVSDGLLGFISFSPTYAGFARPDPIH